MKRVALSENRHHILFPRATWESDKSAKELRVIPQLQVPLPLEVHKELHREISTVPMFDRFMAARVLKDFIPIRDSYAGTARALIESIEGARQHFRTTKLENGLGELAIYALQLQLPYIEAYHG